MRKNYLKLRDSDRQELAMILSKPSLTVKIHQRVKSLLLLDARHTFVEVSR